MEPREKGGLIKTESLIENNELVVYAIKFSYDICEEILRN